MVIGITGIIVTTVAVVGTGEVIAEAVAEPGIAVPAAVRTAGQVAEGGLEGQVAEGGPGAQVETGGPAEQGQAAAADKCYRKNNRIEITRK